jgi:hypothetical protein
MNIERGLRGTEKVLLISRSVFLGRSLCLWIGQDLLCLTLLKTTIARRLLMYSVFDLEHLEKELAEFDSREDAVIYMKTVQKDNPHKIYIIRNLWGESILPIKTVY